MRGGNGARPKTKGTDPDVGHPTPEAARVLAIDDDSSTCRMLELALTKRGYQVTTCSDSHRAIGLLKESPYACVLLDIRMSGLQGTELLPIIKHNFPALPVIIVSAYGNRSDASYYNSLGAFDFLTKPVSRDLLIDTINRAVGAVEEIPMVLTSLSLTEVRDQVYRKLIVTALRKANWNQVKAAQLLGVSRHFLIRWMHRLQITY